MPENELCFCLRAVWARLMTQQLWLSPDLLESSNAGVGCISGSLQDHFDMATEFFSASNEIHITETGWVR